MKKLTITTLTSAALFATAVAAPPKDGENKEITEADKAKAIVEHQEGSEEVSIEQDKQSANTRELIIEQTSPKVITLLKQVETLMGKATDSLEDGDTSGDTIAMQTEIIEKIYEAAKERSSGGT